MKRAVYIPCVLAASAFVAWTAVHTDEVTFTLALVLLLSFALGAAFPRHIPVTIAFLGLPVCLMETLANYGLVAAPYPVHPGISWPAMVALVPAVLGSVAGAWGNRISGSFLRG
jgi:hypothetical protein